MDVRCHSECIALEDRNALYRISSARLNSHDLQRTIRVLSSPSYQSIRGTNINIGQGNFGNEHKACKVLSQFLVLECLCQFGEVTKITADGQVILAA